MNLDCSSLSLLSIDKVVNGSNETNKTVIMKEIWFSEDISSIFDPKFWNHTQFYVGFMVTVMLLIAIPCFIVYVYYPHYDNKQKRVKLRILYGLHAPILEKDILPHLQPYCEYNKDIINLILHYARIKPIKAKNTTQYMNTLMASNITKQVLKDKLITYLFASTLLILCYAPMYFVIARWEDSYRSYIEIECIAISHTPSTYGEEYLKYIWEFDMNGMCNEDTININDYTFYAQIVTQRDDSKVNCYINKHDFNVRNDGRNGKCCGDQCTSWNSNLCCYIVIIVLSVIMLSFYFKIFVFDAFTFLDGYRISGFPIELECR